MENPHEQQQSALLSRIVANISKLNHNMVKVNQKLEVLNKNNSDIEQIAHMWTAYDKSVRIHLDNQKDLLNKK